MNDAKPKLEYGPYPKRVPRPKTKVPLYLRYVPLVEEFIASGEDSARVIDDVEGMALRQRVETARFHSSDRLSVEVSQVNGEVWLRRSR